MHRNGGGGVNTEVGQSFLVLMMSTADWCMVGGGQLWLCSWERQLVRHLRSHAEGGGDGGGGGRTAYES